MKELAKHIYDETNGLHYTLHGDYYLPDLEYHTPHYPIGRWGQMHLDYLKENHPTWMNQMLLDGTLNEHLYRIDRQAQERYNTLIVGYKRCWGITEELKAQDQMKWVGLMNLARYEAEQNIMTEIIAG